MVATAPPKPLMFVSRDLDHKWIGNYMKKKHLALSHLIGKPETTSLYFSRDDFAEMIDQISGFQNAAGVKLYFASYCDTGVEEIDALSRSGWVDRLTVLFAATDSGRNDLGLYLMIKPSGGVLPLSTATAQTLTQCYKTKKMPFLTTLIKDAGVENFRETKSFWYPLANFNGPYGIIKEMKMNGAAGMTAFIGSYGHKEMTPAEVDVSWQMNVVFEFVKEVQHQGVSYFYHFDLENTPGWADRPEPPKTSLFIEGADTGNPCPPATCGAGLP